MRNAPLACSPKARAVLAKVLAPHTQCECVHTLYRIYVMNSQNLSQLLTITTYLIASSAVSAWAQAPVKGPEQSQDSSRSFKFYGLMEGHAIRDFGQSGPSDIFTDLASQPLDNSGGLKGKTRYTAETSRLGLDASTPINGIALAAKLEIDFYGWRVEHQPFGLGRDGPVELLRLQLEAMRCLAFDQHGRAAGKQHDVGI